MEKLYDYIIYPDGETPEIDPRFKVLREEDQKWGGTTFVIADGEPVLPLKAEGKLWHNGWDIPTHWAIDANNQCWKDEAHGGALSKCEPNYLLSDAESHEDKVYISKILELKPPRAPWIDSALAAGWKPPDGWEE